MKTKNNGQKKPYVTKTKGGKRRSGAVEAVKTKNNKIVRKDFVGPRYPRFYSGLPIKVGLTFMWDVYRFYCNALRELSLHSLYTLYDLAWPTYNECDVRAILDIEVMYHNYGMLPRSVFASQLAIQNGIRALFNKNSGSMMSALSGIQNSDRKTNCILRFLAAEEKNRQVNELFRNGRENYFTNQSDKDLYKKILIEARRKVSEILGPVPNDMDLSLRFSRGSNTTVKEKTGARYKLASPLVCSKRLMNSGRARHFLLAVAPSWVLEKNFKFVYGQAELTTVRKDWEIDRTIMIEPLVNTVGQIEIGKYLKHRFKLVTGIDLSDQTPNQLAAFRATLSGCDDSTIDFVDTSNRIAYGAVLELVNMSWFDYLNDWRTDSYYCKDLFKWTQTPDGKDSKKFESHELEMFSSMGNGFTFELESILIYSLTWAASCAYDERFTPNLTKLRGSLKVFGDDLIIDRRYMPTVAFAMNAFGFEINPKKSHFNGWFRESCGENRWHGYSVTPFRVKDNWTYARLVALHNFMKSAERHSVPMSVAFDGIAQLCIDALPHLFKIWGPPGYGDGHLIDGDLSFSDLKQSKQPWFNIRHFETYVQQATCSYEPLVTDYLYASYKAQSNSIGSLVLSSVRDASTVAAFSYLFQSDLEFKASIADLQVKERRLLQAQFDAKTRDPFASNHSLREKKVRVYILAGDIPAS